MKNFTMILIFAVITFFSCTNYNESPMTKRQLQKKDTYLKTKIEDKVTWKDYEIKGKVKQYTRAEYKIVNENGKLQKRLYRKQLINFDADGKILDACDLNVKGEKTARGNYAYDRDGRLTGLISYDANDRVIQDVKYIYNGKGIKIRQSDYNVNLDINSTWVYDENGNVIENTEYSKDRLLTDIRMKYHKGTNAMIEEDVIRYKPDGQFNFREITKYNKYEVVLSRFKYKDKNKTKPEIKERHYYDKNGCESRLYIQSIGTRPVTCIYKNTYDEKSLLSKSTSPFYTWIFKYDSRGNQVKKTSYTAQDYLELELYNEYDMDNNMIKETRIEYDRSPGAGINKKITTIFDKDGKPVEWERDDKEGHYKHRTLYNDMGIMTEQVIDSPGDGRPRIKITYKVDPLGNTLEKKESVIYKNDDELLTNIYEYTYVFY